MFGQAQAGCFTRGQCIDLGESGAEIFLFDQREEAADLRFAILWFRTEHFLVAMPRLARTPQREQRVRLGFAHIRRDRVAVPSKC